jgi:two-component system sensor histidine kinase DesK
MPAPGRFSGRSLVLAVLACALVAKLFDALPHPDAAYVPFVLAVYVLPFWYASGRARRPWEEHRWALLVVQAVLTYVPFAVFGHHWVGGVSGLLAGLALLLLPLRVALVGYLCLVGLELALWSMAGLPYEPATNAATWLVVAFANQSLVLFGLTRLADLVDALDADRDALAGIEVSRQRLAATARLRDTVQARLHRVASDIDAALATDRPDEARTLVRAAGRAAREAAADARRLALDPPDAVLPAPRPDLVAPRIARAITVGVLLLFAAQFLVNVCFPTGSDRPGWGTDVGAVLVAAGVVALQLRHSSTGLAGPRPAAWPVTLVLLTVLAFAFYPSVGAASLLLLAFTAASALLLIRHWSRWLALVAVAVGVPWLALQNPLETITWVLYASATLVAASLLVYGLARLTQSAVVLGELQERIAEAARVEERLRLARDAHDVLGLGLSTIALKTDLVAALVEQDPQRSRHEAVQALHLARLVATDVDAVNGDRLSFTIATEVSTARQSLAAADVRADIDVDPDLPEADALAAVLREAVTNVLRHSRATRCRIRLTVTGDSISLVVANDGVTPVAGGEPGRGLVNMSERLHAVSGSLNTRLEGEEFTLTAVVPA